MFVKFSRSINVLELYIQLQYISRIFFVTQFFKTKKVMFLISVARPVYIEGCSTRIRFRIKLTP